MPVINLAVIL